MTAANVAHTCDSGSLGAMRRSASALTSRSETLSARSATSQRTICMSGSLGRRSVARRTRPSASLFSRSPGAPPSEEISVSATATAFSGVSSSACACLASSIPSKRRPLCASSTARRRIAGVKRGASALTSASSAIARVGSVRSLASIASRKIGTASGFSLRSSSVSFSFHATRRCSALAATAGRADTSNAHAIRTRRTNERATVMALPPPESRWALSSRTNSTRAEGPPLRVVGARAPKSQNTPLSPTSGTESRPAFDQGFGARRMRE